MIFCAQETRYRQRYLDLMMNGNVRGIFETRARIISFIRRFFDTRGFLEVRAIALIFESRTQGRFLQDSIEAPAKFCQMCGDGTLNPLSYHKGFMHYHR